MTIALPSFLAHLECLGLACLVFDDMRCEDLAVGTPSRMTERAVVQALAEAAAGGARSENAAHIYRQKELGGLDRRIQYLQKRLPNLNIVRESPSGDAVYFGAAVEVCNDDGESLSYRIVGPDETDAKTSANSMDSPLAKALRAKRVDDKVAVTFGENTTTLNIVSIRYEQPE